MTFTIVGYVLIAFLIILFFGSIGWYASYKMKNESLNKISGWTTIISFIIVTIIMTLYLMKKITLY